jgi:hypothetical protein
VLVADDELQKLLDARLIVDLAECDPRRARKIERDPMRCASQRVGEAGDGRSGGAWSKSSNSSARPFFSLRPSRLL